MKKIKVALAMSGGIDSSVSALLLKKQGYDVTGFFIKFWSDPACETDGKIIFREKESLERAKRTAEKINIPFRVIDAKKTFRKIVVGDFISGYKNARTPNPCVVCNKSIKFGWFLDLAEKKGFDKIATGHYARIKKDKDGIFGLYSGQDKTKDQSYFLHQLDQKQLSKIIFPLGKLAKKEVYEIAEKNKLSFDKKKESQEICFIPDNNYGQFLKKHLGEKYFKSGKIVDCKGNEIGKHCGIINYTVGQRKGIDQSFLKNENRKPLYVIELGKKGNKLVVGEEKEIYKNKMDVKKMAWISEKSKKEAFKNDNLLVKIRYRHAAAPCWIISLKNNSRVKVVFGNPQRAATPGQYAVFYAKSGQVLGGGTII